MTIAAGSAALASDELNVHNADGTLKSSLTITTPTINGGLLAQNIAFSSDISPSSLSADQDNYNPTGLSTASTLRLTSSTSVNITGLADGATGRLLLIHNIGSSNIVLKDESASSTAANRFALSGDVTVGADQSVILQYDSTSSRWRAASTPSSAHVSGGASSLSDISTSSTSFVDMTGMSVTIASNGKPTLIMFTGCFDTPARVFFRIMEDGVAIHDGSMGDDHSQYSLDGLTGDMACIIYRTPSVGSHTYTVQWKTSAGTSYMRGAMFAPFRLTVVEL